MPPSAPPRSLSRLALAVVVAVAVGTSASAQDQEAAPPPAADSGPAGGADTTTTVPYEVTLSGVEDDDLKQALDEASLLRDLQDEPPATVLGLRRRAEEDARRLRRVLESEGYYAAAIRFTVDTEGTPAQVTLSVDRGPVYSIDSLTIDYADAATGQRSDLPKSIDDLGATSLHDDRVIERGAPAEAETVLRAIDRVQRLLQERGYPKAAVSGHKATVNHADKTMAVTVSVDAGRLASFGETTITGTQEVETDYLRRQQPWTVGETYDISAVETFRRRLLSTGLFDTVNVEPADDPGPDGRMPMAVQVEEADQRSIGVGARYSTSLGPTVSTFWEHRNLLGEDEDFRAEAEVSGQHQTLGADFAKPHFLRRDQSLKLSSELAREQFEAYNRSAIETTAGLERRLDEELTVGAGLSMEYARLTDSEGSRRSTLFGVPLTLGHDNTDDLLDPSGGSRLALAVTPYTGVYDGPVSFGKLRAELSSYTDLFGDGDSVLASRIAIGGTVGAGRSGVPPDKRFFAGGGGSVRGFGYQMAGSLDEEKDPIGGNSLVEASLELRQKITPEIGLVPFIDVGRAYEKAVPTLREDLFMAWGLGARYYSPVGPIRFDLAIPVRPRRNIDDRYQIYLSLGQAF